MFYVALTGAAAAQGTPAGCASWTEADEPGVSGGGDDWTDGGETVHETSHPSHLQ